MQFYISRKRTHDSAGENDMVQKVKPLSLFFMLSSLVLFGFAVPEGPGFPGLSLSPWAVLFWTLLFVFLVWLAMAYQAEKTPLETAQFGHGHDRGHGHEAEEGLVSDDLKVIEGIGPKTQQVLANAGIVTFAQLAQTPAENILHIIREADLRLGDPTTWPEQAALAAKEEWAALETLQDELKWGRRV